MLSSYDFIGKYKMTVKKELLDLLSKNPKLADRMYELLLIAENKGDSLITRADDAEMAVIRQMRQLGQEMMSCWATKETDRVSKNI